MHRGFLILLHIVIVSFLVLGFVNGKAQFAAGYLALYLGILFVSRMLRLKTYEQSFFFAAIAIGFSARLFDLYRIPLYDKGLHTVVPLLIALALSARWPKRKFFIFLIVLSLGLIWEGIEFTAQSLFTGYSMGTGLDTLGDIGCNAIGATLGLLKRRAPG